MTGDDRTPNGSRWTDEALVQTLREASDADLAPGAAERVAAAAWRRVRGRRRRSGILFASPFLRRGAAAAAVLVAAIAGIVIVRGTDPALAVEGEPVQVRDGKNWRETRKVPAGTTVWVSASGSTLRADDGSHVRPDIGSVFHVTRAAGRFELQFVRGAGTASGRALVINVGDLEVAPASSSPSIQFGFDGVDEPFDADAAIATLHAGGVPRVRTIEGCVRVLSHTTGEKTMLDRTETVALMSVGSGEERTFRLAAVAQFSTEALGHIASGHPVFDARPSPGGGIALLVNGGERLNAFEIDASQIGEALPRVNRVMEVLLEGFSSSAESAPAVNVFGRLEIDVSDALLHQTPATQITFTKNGATTDLRVLHDGTVRLRDASGEREFPSLHAAREQAPDAMRRFAEHLGE